MHKPADFIRTIGDSIEAAARSGKINGGPFAEYAAHAAEIFGGFAACLEMIQVSRVLQEADGDEDREGGLNPNKEESLLRMMQATAELMNYRAGDLARWAQDRMREDE